MFHPLRRLHAYLLRKSRAYAWWQTRSYKRHVHQGLAGLAVCLVLVLSFIFVKNVLAVNSWTQTDWSGGVGTSTSTQYSSQSNLDTTGTAGETSIAPGSNKLADAGFESGLTGWNGGIAPDQLSGMQLWLKADAITGLNDGDLVSSWNDSSGNNNNATQANNTLEPIYKTGVINGYPTVRFDGSNDKLAVSGTITHGTILTVGKHAGSNQVFAEVGGGTISSHRGLYGTACPTYCTYEQYYSNSLSISNGGGGPLNSFSILTGQSPTTPLISTSFALGQGTPSYAYLAGDVAEMLIYDSSLSTANRQSVEAYLQAKYDITGAPYVTAASDNTTYFDGSASVKLVAGSSGGQYVQSVNVGDTNTYTLSAYAYTDGSAVSSSDVELSYDNSPISTTYTSVGGGWYKLTGTLTGANASRNYGVQVMSNKTVYVDDTSLIHYPTSGTLTSAIFDGTTAEDWGTLGYTATTPAGTSVSVKLRTGNNADLSGTPAFSSCSATTNGSDATSACAPDKTRYAQYQVTFSGDGSATPVLQDISIAYSASDTVPPPTNASSVLMYRSDGGASVASNGWDNTNPYFSWTAGADDAGGSGIKGYCLYLGQDNTANVATTEGYLGTSPLDTDGACQFAISTNYVDLSTAGYIGTALTSSDSPYYLLVKAIDNANNVYTGSAAAFHFRYDNTPPSNPAFITAPSQFVSDKAVTLTWDTSGGSGPSDTNSGLAGLQYRVGSSGTWYGDAHNGNQDSTDLLTNDGSYTMQSSPDFANLQEGNNLVYFRTWDNAGNYSPAYVTTAIKINTASPSSPQNVTATPSTNTANSFAFSWLAPASFTGQASNITYCYTVNAVPTSSNCTYTSAGATSLPAGAYATQPGDNTLYVVAKDEAGNINYATAASTTFTANTSAPGIPLNIDIADISVKATSNWKLAISWEAPPTSAPE